MRHDDPLPADLLIRTGQSSDLAKVYARWRQVILRSLGRFKGAGIQPEDTLHDAVVKCMGSSAPLTSEDETRAYLHRIVRNGVAQEFRERQAGRRLNAVSLDDPESEAHAMVEPAATSPLYAAAQRERLARLGEALGELSERQRQAFVLMRFDGLTQDEVAARMGISRRMVVKHLARAMAYCEMRVQYASVEQMVHLRKTAKDTNLARDDKDNAPCDGITPAKRR